MNNQPANLLNQPSNLPRQYQQMYNQQVFERKNFLRSCTNKSSSLTLQMFIYFDQLYSVLYFFAEIILFLFKGTYLPYPPRQLAPEIVGIFFYIAVQLARLRIASTGNKTEMPMYLIYSIVLSAPVFFAYVYYLQYQTYSLAFDLSLTVIGIFFLGCEVISSVISAFTSQGNNVQ